MLTKGLKVGDKATIALVDAVLHKWVDSPNNLMGMTATNLSTPLGKNEARYNTTTVHIGQPTTKRVKRLINTPYIF